jgi:hypothetical protein
MRDLDGQGFVGDQSGRSEEGAPIRQHLPASPERVPFDVSSPDDGQRDQGDEDHQHHGEDIAH